MLTKNARAQVHTHLAILIPTNHKQATFYQRTFLLNFPLSFNATSEYAVSDRLTTYNIYPLSPSQKLGFGEQKI